MKRLSYYNLIIVVLILLTTLFSPDITQVKATCPLDNSINPNYTCQVDPNCQQDSSGNVIPDCTNEICDQSAFVCIQGPLTPTTTVPFVGSGTPTVAGGLPCNPPQANTISTAIGCLHYDPQTFVSDILRWVIGFAGGIALLLMVLGAFQIVTSAGNPESLKSGQEKFTSAIIGLIFIVLAVTLLEIIGVDILQVPGLNR